MKKFPSVLCVGRIYCDLIFRSNRLPHWGQEVFTRNFGCMTGGGAFISAAYLTAFGHPVRLAGLMGGEAPFDAVIQSDLNACDIDGSLLRKGTTPQLTVAIAGQDDRAFITHRDPTPMVCPDILDFDHLHIGELQTLLDCPDLIDLARRAEATLSCDCGDEAHYPKTAKDLIDQLDIFMPNTSELSALETAGINLENHPHLVVKQGAVGAQVRIKGRWHKQPAQKTDTIDATGAGDAFNSGYLHSWLTGDSIETCLLNGTICGATAVASLGGWTGRDKIFQRTIETGYKGAAVPHSSA